MSFGLTFDKLLLIAVIAVFLLGPERLPALASQLARGVKLFKAFAGQAKSRMRDEMGPDFDDIDWKKLDPRQYDPRRIIRDALEDDAPAVVRAPRPVRSPEVPPAPHRKGPSPQIRDAGSQPHITTDRK